jgi:hypothetical protein
MRDLLAIPQVMRYTGEPQHIALEILDIWKKFHRDSKPTFAHWLCLWSGVPIWVAEKLTSDDLIILELVKWIDAVEPNVSVAHLRGLDGDRYTVLEYIVQHQRRQILLGRGVWMRHVQNPLEWTGWQRLC